MASYDALVCGGGPNGLAAAIRLAEAGWSGCLLEANDEVGGAARTMESTLPGFLHDFGAAFFPLIGPAPSIIGRDLAPYGLHFAHAPLPAAHPFPGNRAIALGRAAAETAASIDKVHLGDGAAWSELDDAFGDAMAPFLRAQMQRWPFEELARLVGQLRLAGTLSFARLLVQGVSTVGDRFESDEARAVLAARLREAGGVIATGRAVDRIVVERGRAVGVRAGGDAFGARRAVLSTLDAGVTVRLAGADAV